MPISDEDLHTAMHAYLRRNNPEICRHWFDRIAVLGIERGVLRLLVDEPVRLKYLQRTCLAAFTEAVQSVTGQLLAVRFIGPDGVGGEQPQPTGNHSAGSMNETSMMLDEQMVLSPDYSFDGFVVGPGNRLAHAAAGDLQLVLQPARSLNQRARCRPWLASLGIPHDAQTRAHGTARGRRRHSPARCIRLSIWRCQRLMGTHSCMLCS